MLPMYRSVQSKIRTTYTWRVYEFTLKIQLCRAENTTQLYSDSRSYNLDAGRKSEGKNWNIIFRIQDSENTYPKIMLTSWCQQLNKLQSYHNNMCNFIKSSNNVAYYPNTHTHTHSWALSTARVVPCWLLTVRFIHGGWSGV